jgi:hypothetical protein
VIPRHKADEICIGPKLQVAIRKADGEKGFGENFETEHVGKSFNRATVRGQNPGKCWQFCPRHADK